MNEEKDQEWKLIDPDALDDDDVEPDVLERAERAIEKLLESADPAKREAFKNFREMLERMNQSK